MHTKRISAPASWRIARKQHKWVVNPNCGPYAKASCVPMALMLRDVIKCCDSAHEAKHIVSNRLVKVDGRVITDHSFPVGLMASVSIGEDYYRVALDMKGLKVAKTDAESASTKLVRVMDVRNIRGGKFQCSMHDGRNIILDENRYRTGTTLKIRVPEQEIMESYDLKEGNLALITKGKHMGKTAKITGARSLPGSQPNVIVFDGFEVPADAVFVIGGENYV